MKLVSTIQTTRLWTGKCDLCAMPRGVMWYSPRGKLTSRPERSKQVPNIGQTRRETGRKLDGSVQVPSAAALASTTGRSDTAQEQNVTVKGQSVTAPHQAVLFVTYL